MRTGDSQFRKRLVERLIRAAGASTTGLALAAACAGRSERHELGANDGGAPVGGSGTFGSGGSGAGAGRSSGGGTGAVAAGGTATGVGATGGGLFIDAGNVDAAPDGAVMDAGSNMRVCLAFKGEDIFVTAGTGGSPGCGYYGTTGDGGSSGGSAGGEGGEAPISCPDPTFLPELQGRPCGRCANGEGWDFIANVGTPTVVDGSCCYDLLVRPTQCIYVGRAFLVDDGLVRSSVREGQGWRFGPMPELDELSPATRAALSAAWLKDGAFEHASVATFARFALQLLSVGAPAELLHATMAAGNDEIRHAELCFTLASAYAGELLEPDAFPIGDTLPIQRDLRDIVAETIVEGCIGETLAALQAQAQLAITTDPAVRESLAATVEDETRHAELAWRVVAWALSVGGPEVRRVAERAFAEFEPPKPPVIELEGVDLAAFAAHGRLAPDDARKVALEALVFVVRPCAAALLERDVMPHLAHQAALGGSRGALA
jgi:hypothetical protein